MSETLTPLNPEAMAQTIEPAMLSVEDRQEIVPLVPDTSEVGALDIRALTTDVLSRAESLIGSTVSAGRVAVEGLQRFIALKRMERAGTRLEKMDHKDALYDDLGNAATFTDAPISPTASGEPAKPRSFVERSMDKRLEKKSWELALSKSKRKGVVKAFHGENSEDIGLLTLATARARKSRVGSRYRRGEITAAERRRERTHVDQTPVNFENGEQRRSREEVHSKSRSLRRSVRQPILTRWRDRRRDRAVGTIQTIHKRHSEIRDD